LKPAATEAPPNQPKTQPDPKAPRQTGIVEVNRNLITRPAVPTDLALVLSSWLKCYRFYSNWSANITNDVFYREHHALLEWLLAKPSVEVLVCALAEDPNTVLGYLAIEEQHGQVRTVIHFVYVKAAFRGLGIARRLFQDARVNPTGCAYTHRTRANRWVDEKYPGLLYNPYLALRRQ
jgi:ribosomal protein S18 acetylase RimI-like enzyme